MGGYLDDDVGIWDIDTCIPNSRKDYCVYLSAISEMVDYIQSFSLINFTADKWNFELVRYFL